MSAWLWLLAVAHAGSVDTFTGEWGLDPVASDDPLPMLARLVRTPVATGQAASRYSPDGGVDVGEEARDRVYQAVVQLLGLSSRVALSPDGEGVRVTYGGEPDVQLKLGRKWTKVKREEGHDYKMRARLDGEHLVLERRVKSSVLTETFLPPTRPDELFVVVSLDASGLADGLEFRRAYDALHEADSG